MPKVLDFKKKAPEGAKDEDVAIFTCPDCDCPVWFIGEDGLVECVSCRDPIPLIDLFEE